MSRQFAGRIVALIGLALFATTGASAATTDGSRELTRQGIEALERGDYRHALNAFELATRQAPTDGEALFFFGVAHNRLGAAGEALVAVNRAEALGYTNPRLDLERGYALTNLGRNDSALAALERYSAAEPQSGIAKQLLARLYLRRGEPDRARRLAEEAMQLDPALGDTAGLIIAYANRDAGDTNALGRYVEALVTREPNLPFAEQIRRQIDTGTQTAPDGKRWSLALTAGVGFNDNVIAIGDGVPLPVDISNEESVVGSFAVDAGYALVRTNDDYVRIGYALAANLHESELNDSDLLLHNVSALWQHRFSPAWVASISVSDQYSELGGDKFRNRVSVRPAISYRHSRDWRIEGYVRAATENYFFDTLSINDRDGENAHVGLLAARRLGGRGAELRFGWQSGHYYTDGSNYDRDRTLFFGNIGWQLPREIDLRVSGTYSQSNYSNTNSFTAFQRKRDDDTWSVGATLAKEIRTPGYSDALEIFASVDYVDNDSNIRFFKYDQVMVNAGVTVRF